MVAAVHGGVARRGGATFPIIAQGSDAARLRSLEILAGIQRKLAAAEPVGAGG